MDFNILPESWHMFIRIVVAGILGGVLGIERDIHGRQAGLRTHLLVSAGSALFFILSTHIATFDVIVPVEFTKVTDPGRIAAQIVTGIGFLGAGVILKEGFTVVGLTTSACLWISAAIGMASGAGLYGIATGTTLLALFSLTLLRRFERLFPRDAYRNLLVAIPIDENVSLIIDEVKGKEITITAVEVERDYETQTTTIRMALRLTYRGNVDKLCHKIIENLEQSHSSIKTIKWMQP